MKKKNEKMKKNGRKKKRKRKRKSRRSRKKYIIADSERVKMGVSQFHAGHCRGLPRTDGSQIAVVFAPVTTANTGIRTVSTLPFRSVCCIDPASNVRPAEHPPARLAPLVTSFPRHRDVRTTKPPLK